MHGMTIESTLIIGNERLPVHFWRKDASSPWNASVRLPSGYARVRAELIVLRGDEILVCREEGRMPAMPGGSVEPGESIEHAAVRECREETGISAVNAAYAGVFYADASDCPAPWVAENVPKEEQWLGYLTFVCIGDCIGGYGGYVDEADEDPAMESSAGFIPMGKALRDEGFRPAWKRALERMRRLRYGDIR